MKIRESFTLDQDVREWLRAVAKAEARPISGQVNFLLRRIMEDRVALAAAKSAGGEP